MTWFGGCAIIFKHAEKNMYFDKAESYAKTGIQR